MSVREERQLKADDALTASVTEYALTHGAESAANLLSAISANLRAGLTDDDKVGAGAVAYHAMTDAMVVMTAAGMPVNQILDQMFTFATGWMIKRYGPAAMREHLLRVVEKLGDAPLPAAPH